MIFSIAYAYHLPMSQKRVALSMSEESAAILKEYCSFFGISQSDALNLFARAAIHQHSLHCKKVESILELRQKELDKRADKPCFGFACLSCAYTPRCMAGLYDGLFEVKQEYCHLYKEEGFMTELVYLIEKYGSKA